jgi:porin
VRSVALALLLVVVIPASALAGAKDETAAGWLPLPKWFSDWRDGLERKGLSFGATAIVDNIGNPTGGMKRGFIDFGRLDLGVDADLEKLASLSGLKFHANMFAIYGHGLTRCCIGNLATISEIEALPDVRLYEAYFEQTFAKGALALKVGQQAADVEFFDSETDDLFVNGTFGWPAIKASDLPAGGPAPPIAVPGIRVKAQPAESITAFAAIFNGNAARPGPGDPQLRDNHGLAFRVNDPPWLIGQIRWDYTFNIAGMSLPGNVTPGAWHHFGMFDDQRFTALGLSIADPAGPASPASSAATTAISPCWSRPCTGRHQSLKKAYRPQRPVSPRSPASPTARPTAT